MITSIESIVFEKLPQLQELYVGGNPFQCTCALQSFVEFMQRKGILLQKETWYGTPTCSSPEHLKGKEIINVSYHDMSCDSTSKQAVTLPKTKDDVPTQQIIKTTPRIGDQQTTEPAVTFTKSKDGALTRQTVKTTPRIGDQHTTGKS
ncbi:leucine-rich repeats and immunoglobulin-like domains protein 1 [Crassostrea angulata]|uniref:leucine-rich repeats and immunoglobulin-like domains protein 1 n=1 Tax=Magallana angulata TaxID=2784310 RepID=UPI0022B1AD2C|nr:leucine-rich repeats and immunoglobulin-like domains protein 1 [Crassostrea angulata]